MDELLAWLGCVGIIALMLAFGALCNWVMDALD